MVSTSLAFGIFSGVALGVAVGIHTDPLTAALVAAGTISFLSSIWCVIKGE